MTFWRFIVFFILVYPFFSFSQENDEPTFYKVIQPKHSYSIDVALPVSVANKPFKGIMQGFLRGSAQYQFSLKSGLNFGLGGNYTFFQINRFKITPQIEGGMTLVNGYFKMGLEKYYTKRAGFDGGIKVGYSSVFFKSDSLISIVKTESLIVEPYAAFCLSADDKTAYKWMLSYSFMGFGFTPQRIGDFVNEDYKTTEYKRITRFFSFGFSFSHYFKQW